MAVQLISDLGLHLDPTDHRSIAETSNFDAEITQVRANLFWTVNTLDK